MMNGDPSEPKNRSDVVRSRRLQRNATAAASETPSASVQRRRTAVYPPKRAETPVPAEKHDSGLSTLLQRGMEAAQQGFEQAQKGLRRDPQPRQRAAAQRKTRYQATAPTILVGRSGFGTPVVRRAQTPVRRTMSIPLGTPNAELVVPGLPAINPGWRLLSGFLVMLFGAMIVLSTTMPQLQISTPVVNGVQRIPTADIAAVINMQGTPIYMFDPELAKNQLLHAFPDLKSVEVEIDLPAAIIINAEERQPIAIWKEAEDDINWIDDEGVVFQGRGLVEGLLTIQSDTIPWANQPGEIPGVTKDPAEETKPVDPIDALRVPPIPGHIQKDVLEAAIRLKDMLPANTNLAYNSQNGLGWTAPEGWNVYVGASLTNLDEKLAIYQRIMEQVQQQGLQPSMINVEYPHAPFYRME